MAEPKLVLTLDDFKAAAARLRCGVAEVRAVAEVEAPNGGFRPGGQEPVILFEPKIFSELTGGRFDGQRARALPPKYSLISSPHAPGPGEYGPESAQHARLQAAATLDREAALKSASWGMFQILGRYYEEAGFESLRAFVNAMYLGVDAHLAAFVSLVLHRKLDDDLREHRWADFARRFNGAGYKRNRYDEKLAAAFAKWSAA